MMPKEKHDASFWQIVRSPKHKGDIFIQGNAWLCKVYAYPNGNENIELAEQILNLQPSRNRKEEI